MRRDNGMEAWEGEGGALGKINGQRRRAHLKRGAGFAAGGRFTPLLGLASESGERMSGTAALTSDYGTAWGTPGQLAGGTDQGQVTEENSEWG